MESEREKERHDPEPPQFRFNHHLLTIRQPLLNLLLPTFAFVQPPFAFTALTATHILAKQGNKQNLEDDGQTESRSKHILTSSKGHIPSLCLYIHLCSSHEERTHHGKWARIPPFLQGYLYRVPYRGSCREGWCV